MKRTFARARRSVHRESRQGDGQGQHPAERVEPVAVGQRHVQRGIDAEALELDGLALGARVAGQVDLETAEALHAEQGDRLRLVDGGGLVVLRLAAVVPVARRPAASRLASASPAGLESSASVVFSLTSGSPRRFRLLGGWGSLPGLAVAGELKPRGRGFAAAGVWRRGGSRARTSLLQPFARPIRGSSRQTDRRRSIDLPAVKLARFTVASLFGFSMTPGRLALGLPILADFFASNGRKRHQPTRSRSRSPRPPAPPRAAAVARPA